MTDEGDRDPQMFTSTIAIAVGILIRRAVRSYLASQKVRRPNEDDEAYLARLPHPNFEALAMLVVVMVLGAATAVAFFIVT